MNQDDQLQDELRVLRAENARLTAENKKLTYIVDMGANDLRQIQIAARALRTLAIDDSIPEHALEIVRDALKEIARSDSGK